MWGNTDFLILKALIFAPDQTIKNLSLSPVISLFQFVPPPAEASDTCLLNLVTRQDYYSAFRKPDGLSDS